MFPVIYKRIIDNTVSVYLNGDDIVNKNCSEYIPPAAGRKFFLRSVIIFRQLLPDTFFSCIPDKGHG